MSEPPHEHTVDALKLLISNIKLANYFNLMNRDQKNDAISMAILCSTKNVLTLTNLEKFIQTDEDGDDDDKCEDVEEEEEKPIIINIRIGGASFSKLEVTQSTFDFWVGNHKFVKIAGAHDIIPSFANLNKTSKYEFF